MQDDYVLDRLAWAQKYVCPATIGGWLWHCDEHDTHGNADSDDEAWVLAGAHATYYADDEVGEVCQLIVWSRATGLPSGRPDLT